jgi:ADP-ribosylglycohydrolase
MSLLENTRAGGDSAARGMIIGMILGASLGYEKLPQDWLETMNAKV